MIYLLSLLLGYTSGFLITTSRPSKVKVAPGEKVTLFCAVDDDYEWCKFYHPNGKFCDFEWKRSQGNITMQECQLSDKVKFHGAYDDRECGITFTAGLEDTGTWRCEIEEYVLFSSRGAGRVQTAQMIVKVQSPTTTTTTTTTKTTTTTTTTIKTSPSTTRRTQWTPITTRSKIETTQSSTSGTTGTTTSTTTSTTRSTTRSTTINEIETTADFLDILTTHQESVISDDGSLKTSLNETPEAIPQTEESVNSEAEGSSPVVISVSVIIVILIVTIGSISGGIFYRRKINSSEAAVAYDKEAKIGQDQAGLGGNSISNITFLANSGDSSNLHEFFPPKLASDS